MGHLRYFLLVLIGVVCRPSFSSDGNKLLTLKACAQGLTAESGALVPEFSIDTVGASRNYPDRAFEFKGGAAYNGSNYPEFRVVHLPRTGVRIFVAKPKGGVRPRARLIFLHGLGLSISNVGSVLPVGRIVHFIGEGGGDRELPQWFAAKYPHLVMPLEIVAFDIPSAGWAPGIENFSSTIEMAEYVARVIEEIQELDPVATFPVSRSASSVMAILARKHIKGTVITGSTFPNAETLEMNRDEVILQERSGDTVVKWDVVNAVLDQFKHPSLLRAIEEALGNPDEFPVRSLIGDRDGETPPKAHELWKNVLRLTENPMQRSQYILKGAKHQVFLRPEVEVEDPEHPGKTRWVKVKGFSEDHSDIQAFRLLLEFVKYHTE